MDPGNSEDGLQYRRRRLRFRSWHRGTREADLLLGRFADAHLDSLTGLQLDRYAALLENSDPDLYDWITGAGPVPGEFDNDILALLRSFTLNGLNT